MAVPLGLVRIRNGLTAFGCGDALGVPWEGRGPGEIDAALLPVLPRRGDWPAGATSDDTDQLILLARNLVVSGGAGDPRGFLAGLVAGRETIRGMGRTTRRAIDRFVATGALRAEGGRSNGALMRVLPVGWATPPDAADRRRAVVEATTTTTHGDPIAVATAAAVAAMGSSAVEGVRGPDLVAVALRELDHFGLGPDVEPVREAAEGVWAPPARGVSVDVVDTLAAVVQLVGGHEDTDTTMRRAVMLGGDTDTVAAIAGGIVGALDPELRLPWAAAVALPPDLGALAAGLWELRRGRGR
jgi:ADP-ribosylglycohydrolase